MQHSEPSQRERPTRGHCPPLTACLIVLQGMRVWAGIREFLSLMGITDVTHWWSHLGNSPVKSQITVSWPTRVSGLAVLTESRKTLSPKTIENCSKFRFCPLMKTLNWDVYTALCNLWSYQRTRTGDKEAVQLNVGWFVFLSSVSLNMRKHFIRSNLLIDIHFP